MPHPPIPPRSPLVLHKSQQTNQPGYVSKLPTQPPALPPTSTSTPHAITLAGDVTINPNASCLVMTTEILRSMMYRGTELVRQLALIVYDEIHYLR